jgi:hypothetical protein
MLIFAAFRRVLGHNKVPTLLLLVWSWPKLMTDPAHVSYWVDVWRWCRVATLLLLVWCWLVADAGHWTHAWLTITHCFCTADPFAANVRRGLRKKGLSSGVPVVFSDELPLPASLALTNQRFKQVRRGMWVEGCCVAETGKSKGDLKSHEKPRDMPGLVKLAMFSVGPVCAEVCCTAC